MTQSQTTNPRMRFKSQYLNQYSNNQTPYIFPNNRGLGVLNSQIRPNSNGSIQPNMTSNFSNNMNFQNRAMSPSNNYPYNNYNGNYYNTGNPNMMNQGMMYPNNTGNSINNMNNFASNNGQNMVMTQNNSQTNPTQSMQNTQTPNPNSSNRNLNLNLTDEKKREDDIIKNEVDKLLLARLKDLMKTSGDKKKSASNSDSDSTPKQDSANKTELSLKNSSKSVDQIQNSENLQSNKQPRKAFIDAIGGLAGSLGGGIGDMAQSVGGGLGGAMDAVGGPGVAIGAGAAAAGAMKKDQREMEHRFALTRLENEMASTTFGTDFQDQALMDLSKAIGRMEYNNSRIKSIMKCFDYSMERMVDMFYETVH